MMKVMTAAVILIGTGLFAHANGGAVQQENGLFPVDYSISNRTGVMVSCDVTMAHWYSDHLAAVGPDETGYFTLWSDVTSGTVYRLNDAGDRMPVERVWCGVGPDTWRNRHDIGLPRHGGQLPQGVHLTCALCDGQVYCVDE